MKRSRQLVWARNLVIAAVVLAFVAFFGQPGAAPTLAPVAELDGEPISRESFEFFREQNEDLVRRLAPQELDPTTFQQLLDNQTLDGLVRRHVIAWEARELGLLVSDKEVRSEVLANPGFRRDGRFERELFERFVVRSGLEGPRAYTTEVQRDLLLQKFQRLISSPVRVSRAAAEEAVRRERTQVRVRVAVARPEQFREGLEITPEEIEAFAQRNPAPINERYQERLAEFRRPEEIRARHILLTGEGALERAEEALVRIEQGEDFATIAGELSDDLATKKEGGDLGFFPRGRMLPEFEEAAFALEPGETSRPVETVRGVHVIQMEERKAGFERTLEEVTPELARELLEEERAREEARLAADRMAGLLGAGRGFEEIAREVGLEVQTPHALRWTETGVPGLGPAEELRAAAFRLQPDQPDLPRVFEVQGGFALISLVEREDPDPEELGDGLLQTQEKLARQLRSRILERWYRARQEELQRNGRLRYFSLNPPG
jgi:peptidyl-prolyl cis-trans isomerase D